MAIKYQMKPDYRCRLGDATYELMEYDLLTNSYKMLDKDDDAHTFSGEFVEEYMEEVVDD